MFSGGLDSTGALIRLLTETEEPIHVHHIILKNIENRWRAEDKAVEDILDFCQKKYRPFKFTNNIFEFMQFEKFYGWDNDIVRFIAAQIAKDDPNITQVALGKCADDTSPAFKLRAIQAHAIWRSSFFDIEWQPPAIIRPVENMTKKELVEYLPPELFLKTWSCRHPVEDKENNIFHPCFECDTCKKLHEYEII